VPQVIRKNCIMTSFERDLPDFVDLVVTGSESGLGIDAALVEAATHLPGPLAEAVNEAQREIFNGRPRREALMGLAARANLPELGTFVTQLIQADAMGTTMGGALRTLADDCRHRQFMRAKERAAKLPTQMTVVNVLFIPALLMTLLGAMASGKLLGFVILGFALCRLLPSFAAPPGVKRQRALEGELANALMSLAGALRTGHSFPAAADSIAPMTPAPLGPQLQRLADAARTGANLEGALRAFADETGSRDVRQFAAAVLVQRRTGSNLADLLLNLSRTISERVRLRRELDALIAQPKFTAALLTALPLVLGLMMLIVRTLVSLFDGLFGFVGPKWGALLLAAAVGVQWLILWVTRKLTASVEAGMG